MAFEQQAARLPRKHRQRVSGMTVTLQTKLPGGAEGVSRVTSSGLTHPSQAAHLNVIRNFLTV